MVIFAVSLFLTVFDDWYTAGTLLVQYCDVAHVSCNVARVFCNVACVSCNVARVSCNVTENTCNITIR